MSLEEKFRGCMLGVLAGDCLGSSYEGEDTLTLKERDVLQELFDTLCSDDQYEGDILEFTDDSAMTKCIAQSLIKKHQVDLNDIAKSFGETYFDKPDRGYGQSVVKVFEKWKASKYLDVEGPAKEQFNGEGSCGNGGAMRVAPLPLFFYNQKNNLDAYVESVTKLTHTHVDGINGALLQARAILECLHLDPQEAFDIPTYLNKLIKYMDELEDKNEIKKNATDEEKKPYSYQLRLIRDMLEKNLESKEAPPSIEVVNKLGNYVTALHSVPAAIFSFLLAHQEPNIPGITTKDTITKAIQYAISLGGDTDTIGSMAGAIAGAFYGSGEGKLSEKLLKYCENFKEFTEIADKLHAKISEPDQKKVKLE